LLFFVAESSGSEISMPMELQLTEQQYNPQYSAPAEQQQQYTPEYSASAEQQQQYTPQVQPPTSTTQVTSPAVTPTQNQAGSSSKEQTFQQTELYQPVAPHGTDKTIIGYYGEYGNLVLVMTTKSVKLHLNRIHQLITLRSPVL
jgi:cell division protein FtsN